MVSRAGAYRKLPAWQKSLELAEHVYRLAEVVTAARGQALAELLLARIMELPALAAQESEGTPTGQARGRLLEIEAGLLLAVRLRYLSEAQVGPALSLVVTLTEELAGGTAAPTPAPTTPQAPSVPGAEPATPAPLRAGAPARPPAPPAQAATDYLLLDGCNFLGCAPGYELGDESSRDRLLFRLQEYAREHPAHKVVVFFDGKRASSRVTAGVEERVTSGLHSADDLMIDYLRGLSREDRRRTTLVTDDRELAARVRREGVRAESVQWLSARFVRRAPAGMQKQGLSRAQVSEWEQFFSEPPKRPGKR